MKWLAAAICLALLAAGCGEKEDALEPSGSKSVELMLDYFPNADHAGIYAAQAGGDFKEAGLDVKIRQPPDPAAPIKQVAAGRVDLAISYEPEVLRARDQGLNVVSVAAIVQKPLTSIISLPKAKIRKPADLEGKTVGTAGIDYQHAYLQTDSPRGGRRAGVGQGAQRRVRPDARPAHRQGRRGARRVLELRGHRPEAARQAPADHPHRGRRRTDLQRAGARGQRGRARARRGQDPRLHRRRLTRHARPAPGSRQGHRRPARGQPATWIPSCSGPWWR